jgi:phage tail-like protein
MTTTQRKDPLPLFCFKLELNVGTFKAGELFFKSVTGLKFETEVVDYKQGGVNDSTHKLVGATKWPNLVFKKGFTGSSEMLQWRDDWLRSAGTKTRAEGFIIAVTTDFTPKMKWKFTRGWPCKWEGPDFDASKNEVAIESLEIAHEGLEFIQV